jgi:O-antigen/teichoic acid export membrane protein
MGSGAVASEASPGPFLRQVGTVAAGVAAGQLILLVATPFLARVYSPAQFGVYALFMAMYVVTTVASCMRFEIAIPLAAPEMLDAVIQASALSGLAAAMAIAIIAVSGVASLWKASASTMAWLAVCAPLLALMQTGIYASIRDGRFHSNVVVRILQPAAFVAAALSLPAFGLVAAQAFSVAVAAVFSLWLLRPHLHALPAGSFARVWSRFRAHPTVSLPSTLLDTLSLACPFFVISAAYGPDTLGNYSQIQRLLGAPLYLLAIGVSEVFMRNLGRQEPARLRPLVLSTFWRLALLAAALFAAALLVGSELAHLLLGAQWRTDTSFVLLVLSPALVRMSVSPITGVFAAARRLRVATGWQVAYFALTFSLLPAFAWRWPIERFLLGYLALEAAMYSIYLGLALAVAGRPARDP